MAGSRPLSFVWHARQLLAAIGVPSALFAGLFVYTKYLQYDLISPKSVEVRNRMRDQDSISQTIRDEYKIGNSERFFDNTDKLFDKRVATYNSTPETTGDVDAMTQPHGFNTMDIHSSAIYSDLRYTYSRIKRLDRLAYALYAELMSEKLSADESRGVINGDHIKRLECLLTHISEASEELKLTKGVADYSPFKRRNDGTNLDGLGSLVHNEQEDAEKGFSFEKFRDLDRNGGHKQSSGIEEGRHEATANIHTGSTEVKRGCSVVDGLKDVMSEK